MPLQTGQTLNSRYRIVKLLGQGGFGAVYKAWDTKLNGPCAIKENFETSPEAEKQFAREASMLFNLRHPSLPRVFDHFSIPAQGQYLVMDYIEGQDLQEILNHRGKPLTESEVLPWVEQICDALQYLHNQNPPIIHRDIKPANIKITPDGQAVLVDFGIAKIYNPQLKTTMGARAITPGYSPPEQYGQGSTNPRTDVYALGATLYTILTNSTPPDSVDIITKKQSPPPPVRVLNPGVSPSMDAVINRAMQLDDEQRFQSAAELKTALTTRQTVFSPLPASQPSVVKTTYAPDSSTQPVDLQPEPVALKGLPKWLPWVGVAFVVFVCVSLAGIGLGTGIVKNLFGRSTPVAESSTGVTPGSSQAGSTDESTLGTGGLIVTPQDGSLSGTGFKTKLSLQGQIGGNTYAVAMQGNLVYLGVGPRVYVLDVSNPSTPLFVSQSGILPGVVRNIIAAGNYLYVAAEKGYLQILDISNPAQPLVVAAYTDKGYAQGLAIEGNSLYIADNPFGLRVIDVSDPLNPTKVGEANVPGAASSVSVAGSRAYLAGSSLGSRFAVIDISNTAAPVEIGSVDIPDAQGSIVYAVQVKGNYAYVAAGNAGLVVLDITNATQPVKVGNYQTSWADGLVINGNSLYLSDWADGLHVLDISNPTNPVQTCFMEIKLSGQGMPGQRNLVAQSGLLLVANINQGLTIYNYAATSGANPPEESANTSAGAVVAVPQASSGAASASAATSTCLVLMGKYDVPLSGAAWDDFVSGGIAYVIEDALGMYTADVSDPTQARQLGFDISTVRGGLRTPRGVVTQGNYAYVVDINNGFSIYDVSNPANPVELSRVEEPQGMTKVAIAGNYAYISLQGHGSTNSRGLLVFDISNPSHPNQVGYAPDDFSAMTLAIQGNYAFYPEALEMSETGQPASLRIFDISNPGNPVQTGEADITNIAPSVFGIDVAGNYVYLGDQTKGLQIFDISNSNQPQLVGSLPDIVMVMDLVVVGDKVFTASYGTVDVIDVSDPTHPIFEDYYQTPGYSMGIYAIDNTIYVADFDGGLVILKYTE